MLRYFIDVICGVTPVQIVNLLFAGACLFGAAGGSNRTVLLGSAVLYLVLVGL